MLSDEQNAETLRIMRELGVVWLADMLEQMLGGDPWQEGMYAKEILEKYRMYELHMEA